MASKNFDAIVSDIIDNILVANPSADVKVGEVIRDVFIDVQAVQIQAVYGIADSAARAQSVLTARAQQLDRLAYNVNLRRNPSTRASTVVVVSIKGGAQAPTLLSIGDQFFTQGDDQNAVQTFINTQATILAIGQTQATLPVINTNTGTSGNVAALTITGSNYDFADAVYNPIAAEGGNNVESDASLATRIPLQVTGQFLNTSKGIQRAILPVSDLNGTPYIVTPDNPLSRGQYTTDVYLQRSSNYNGTPYEETIPANAPYFQFSRQPIYDLLPINSVSVFNPVTNQFVAIPENLNGVTNYQIIRDGSDAQGFFKGTVKDTSRLSWVQSPPSTPYIISYNYDHTIIDTQASYDSNNEITNDLLFKQSLAIPIYVAASISAIQGSNLINIYQNAQSNLSTLFNNLSIGQSLTANEVELALLGDTNVYNATLTNLDATYGVTLSFDSSGNLIENNLGVLDTYGFYYQNNLDAPNTFFTQPARLWIGDPNVIKSQLFNATTGFTFNQTIYNGVADEETVAYYTPSWKTNVYKSYDPISQTCVLGFSVAAPAGATLVLNFINKTLNTLNNLSYLTLAPSLTSPIKLFQSTAGTSNPQYATVLPTTASGTLSASSANVYKNGVLLSPATTSASGDYSITAPDTNTGIVQIQFSSTATPNPLDVLQYGILNPNINVSFTSSQFVR